MFLSLVLPAIWLHSLSLSPLVMAGFELHVRLETYDDGMKTHTSTLSSENCVPSCYTKFKFCLLDYGCEETDILEESGLDTTVQVQGETLWPVNATLNVTATGMDNTVLGEFRAKFVGLLPTSTNSYTAPAEYTSIGNASKAIKLQYRVVCTENYSGDQCTPVCSPECGEHGECTAPGNCTCAEGYDGPNSTCKCFVEGTTDYFKNETAMCVCKDGYAGPTCETVITACDGITCENGGTCISIDNTESYKCQCTKGFSGNNCSNDIDECTGSVCPVNSTCNNTFGSYECTCDLGLTGENCDDDINECETGIDQQPVCSGNTVCVNIHGSYQCIVLPNSSSTDVLVTSAVATATMLTSTGETMLQTPTPTHSAVPTQQPEVFIIAGSVTGAIVLISVLILCICAICHCTQKSSKKRRERTWTRKASLLGNKYITNTDMFLSRDVEKPPEGTATSDLGNPVLISSPALIAINGKISNSTLPSTIPGSLPSAIPDILLVRSTSLPSTIPSIDNPGTMSVHPETPPLAVSSSSQGPSVPMGCSARPSDLPLYVDVQSHIANQMSVSDPEPEEQYMEMKSPVSTQSSKVDENEPTEQPSDTSVFENQQLCDSTVDETEQSNKYKNHQLFESDTGKKNVYENHTLDKNAELTDEQLSTCHQSGCTVTQEPNHTVYHADNPLYSETTPSSSTLGNSNNNEDSKAIEIKEQSHIANQMSVSYPEPEEQYIEMKSSVSTQSSKVDENEPTEQPSDTSVFENQQPCDSTVDETEQSNKYKNHQLFESDTGKKNVYENHTLDKNAELTDEQLSTCHQSGCTVTQEPNHTVYHADNPLYSETTPSSSTLGSSNNNEDSKAIEIKGDCPSAGYSYVRVPVVATVVIPNNTGSTNIYANASS